MPKEMIPECCKGCFRWERFKRDCWVYWEGKKKCTQHTNEVNGWNVL